MSLQEMKELVGTIFFSSALLTLAILFVMNKFAEITYKRAHRKNNMTLQEIIELKKQMRKELIENA